MTDLMPSLVLGHNGAAGLTAAAVGFWGNAGFFLDFFFFLGLSESVEESLSELVSSDPLSAWIMWGTSSSPSSTAAAAALLCCRNSAFSASSTCGGTLSSPGISDIFLPLWSAVRILASNFSCSSRAFSASSLNFFAASSSLCIATSAGLRLKSFSRARVSLLGFGGASCLFSLAFFFFFFFFCASESELSPESPPRDPQSDESAWTRPGGSASSESLPFATSSGGGPSLSSSIQPGSSLFAFFFLDFACFFNIWCAFLSSSFASRLFGF
mmetsp:Transcript_4177/g.8161  ORF Transcript_4177/g.8161 Transcript_4177/m.8161 type:complete len:270 (+) Transcript_4177:2384-3193(+)